MHQFRRLGLAALLLTALLGACSSDDQSDAEAGDTVSPSSIDRSTTEGSDRQSTTSAASSSGPIQGSVAVDREVMHPAGTSVKVTEITAEGNGVYVDIEAFNSSDLNVRLSHLRGHTRLFTSDGRQLEWQPPDENPTLQLPAGAELEARLAFVGRLSETDGPLLLQLGKRDSPLADKEDVQARYPSFDFPDLPLPEEEQ